MGLSGLSGLQGLSGLVGSAMYAQKILATNPLVYFPQWETAGLVSEELVSGWDGAYIGVTLDDFPFVNDDPTPRFDGATDYNNVLTAQFAAAFDGQVGSLMIWCRVFNAAVWTDGTLRIGWRVTAPGNNLIRINRAAANNSLEWYYRAAGINEVVTLGGLNTLDWFQMVMTWDLNAGVNGEVLAYYNGVQTGLTQGALGNWGANPPTSLFIGAISAAPNSVWNGWLAPGVGWARALTPVEVLYMYNEAFA